jgi:hypothetical protein
MRGAKLAPLMLIYLATNPTSAILFQLFEELPFPINFTYLA